MTQTAIVRRPVAAADELPDNLDPIIKRVLAGRGLTCSDDLDMSLAGLLRTDHLGGIEAAVAVLASAVTSDARIVIVADFDADGATSCAVAMRALWAMGATNVSYLVPNRFEYGYGLTPPIVELAAGSNPQLLITVDNGISSIAGVAAAREAGIEVLITDHHLPGATLPAASAIVNPNVPGDRFPSKNLAGVGVIFYVMLALRSHLRATGWFDDQSIAYPNLAELLDLVALGTVADVVPLDQNNRRLVAQGLARIRSGKSHAGIVALLKIAGRDARRLSSTDLAFTVAPRLNAAGRLADMSLGIECLISDDGVACDKAALALDQLNRERREIEAQMKEQALSLVGQMELDDDELPNGVCLWDEDWHQGVVGIVASRIKDRYHRPVIAFAPSEQGWLKGSGRSIPGVHLRDALDAVATLNPGMLSKFGGHAMAAGLTLEAKYFDAFAEAFDAEIARQVSGSGFAKEIITDGVLEEKDFRLELAEQLAVLMPWGQQFPEPLFDGEFDILTRRVVGENHLRMQLRAVGGEKTYEAIAFNAASDSWVQRDKVRFVYRLSVNEYRGVRNVQIVVEYGGVGDY